MRTAEKLRLFRKEMKTKHHRVATKPSDEEILAYIDAATKAFRHFSPQKQIKMAAAMAADHYLARQRLTL